MAAQRRHIDGTDDGSRDEPTATAGSGSGQVGSGVRAIKSCESCAHELVTIRITVDDNDLVLESCQRCDVRRWHFAGEQIDLQRVLAEVGEHAGRRR